MEKEKRTALITGATSGIGESFARRFAERGYDLILTGRREEKIRGVADEIASNYGVTTQVVIAELSNPDDVAALSERIKRSGNIHVLINNAGFGTGRNDFQDGPLSSHLEMIRCHVEAPVELTHAVLPQMIARHAGIVINVSSVAAFLVFPSSSTYAPTKAYLNSFTEALYMELKGTGVKVQALCPGFTRTDFHPRMGWERSRMKSRGVVRWGSPQEVVDTSLDYLEKDRVLCIPGFLNRILVRIMNWLPRRLYYRIAANAKKHE